MEQTLSFEQRDGMYICEFGSCTGVLQVDCEEPAKGKQGKIVVYTNINGMNPVKRAVVHNHYSQFDLCLPHGLTVQVITSTPVVIAKVITDD